MNRVIKINSICIPVYSLTKSDYNINIYNSNSIYECEREREIETK